MLKSKVSRLAGVGVAAALGVLPLAAPAVAAEPANSRGSAVSVAEDAARINHSDTAAAEELPPNVTMEVLKELPPAQGPVDVYREGGATDAASARAAAAAASSLPFDFKLDDVSYGIPSRLFKADGTRVCMDIKIKTVLNPGAAQNSFGVTLHRDVSGPNDPSLGRVAVPRDNEARSYCWSGTARGTTYYFFFGFGSGGGSSGVYEYVDGNGRVRNP
ncbi:hypothetical protein [Actinoplanes regularis]|uniref:Secreted protein n=1 Tax=Actinoplanes regularis TaxID=52697 RepID=A0A238XL79_9ACTN|nr:hypothetical protein [Actinoplanes regularis]GIE90522.1 hypothetical protein Are01nite_70020 [Actinoplanes regularis]SNR59074.1 hypothetical protein SAMN06264365_103514 [Actinoplanes regularis]